MELEFGINLILAGVLVLLVGPVAVRLGHPLCDLGRSEEGEHLDGGARPIVGILGLHYLRVHQPQHQGCV